MQYIVSFVDFLINMRIEKRTAYNTAYKLRAYALALRDIVPYGRNFFYPQTLSEMPLKKNMED